MKNLIFCIILLWSYNVHGIIATLHWLTEWNRQNRAELWNAFTQSPTSNNTSVREEQPSPTTFADIGGHISPEIRELASYIQDSDTYADMGAQMPRGILMYGPPGTGKTSLARALAGETNAAFFNASGSEFIEVYVGTGPARVRELFNKAREAIKAGRYTKAIIFIDEIDAIGSNRSHEANSEYRNTLNELLNQLDGFEQNNHIFVIAATNFLTNLDPALTRPGRFDRLIKIDLPSETDRHSIIQLYLAKIKHITSDDYVRELAKLTQGFSPAELKNMVNEAAILAIRQKLQAVTDTQLQQAYHTARARKNAR